MFTTRPEILGTFGVVTSTHWQASAAGMAILEKGGNAFDAAVATGCALHVVEPHQNGPGGEVPLVFYSADRDEVKVICGQGVAPAAATLQAYRDLGLDRVPAIGHLAAVVPGSFDAWMLLLRDYGSLTPREVLSPAIALAREGTPITDKVCDIIAGVQGLLETEWRTTAAIYLPRGEPPTPGSLFRNPALAETYLRVLGEAEAAGGDREAQIEAARRAWYKGFVAEAIDGFMRKTAVVDTTGVRHLGFLTGDDMAAWQASVEDPVTYDYHGYRVCKTGPWGQGPVFLQQLALLKDFDLAAMAPDGADFVHSVVECAKLAFADREAYYGDPNFTEVPLEALLSDDYNAVRRRQVGESASLDLRPGRVAGREPRIVARMKGSTEGIAFVESLDFGSPKPVHLNRDPLAAAARPGDTSHFDIIDRWGNMISGTPSGGWLHGSPAVPGLGWGVSARGQMFWLDDELPASLAPGKRPRTTLTPGLALREGAPYMVFGTPGGDQQDQWALLAFLRHLHHGLNLQEAIDCPTFHSAHMPSSFFPREYDPGYLALEGRFSPATVAELRRRGHRIEVFEDWSLGYVTAAAKDGPVLKAGASPRQMRSYAMGR
jgi:gamma-glutamyltranspeptidase/glutathione hydrolase